MKRAVKKLKKKSHTFVQDPRLVENDLKIPSINSRIRVRCVRVPKQLNVDIQQLHHKLDNLPTNH